MERVRRSEMKDSVRKESKERKWKEGEGAAARDQANR